MLKNSDFIIIIRSAGERTSNVCREIVQQQTDGQEIIILNETPFKKALEECFRQAETRDIKWLVTVDADMLLLRDAIDSLLKYAEDMPDHYFQLQGRIIDHITGLVRKAGPRIYRVGLLKKALAISVDADDTVRPESYILNRMAEEGHPSRFISTITSLHDYEQFYSDLYRKAFVHANKHPEFVANIITRSLNKFNEHNDYRVILKAVWDGLHNESKISIDSRLYSANAKQALDEIKLKEKGGSLSLENAQRLIDQVCNEYKNVFEESVEIHDKPKTDLPVLVKAKKLMKKKGIFRAILHSLGSAFARLGEKLKTI